MKTITFTCETITPLFLAGADGTTPELRAPSIKGALRFWWRAMNGHLSLTELRQRETEIWGGTERRSKLIIQVSSDKMPVSEVKLVPHHHQSFKLPAFKTGQEFTIHLCLVHNENFNVEQLKALFILVCTLGGLGKRNRRGMGSIRVVKIDGKTFQCSTLDDIFQYLEEVNPGKFVREKDLVFSRFERDEKYPYIKQIQLGLKIVDLMKISTTTHDFKGEKNYRYSVGYAGRDGRFASPIYVSLIKLDNKELRPIITTLNAVPDKGHPDPKLQEEFRNAILL